MENKESLIYQELISSAVKISGYYVHLLSMNKEKDNT
jgi:hypothetical protein